MTKDKGVYIIKYITFYRTAMCPYCNCELEVYTHTEDDIYNGMPHHWEQDFLGCPRCDYTEIIEKTEVEYEYYI